MAEQTNARSMPSAQDVLDALPAAAVVLDRFGAILAVNRAWNEFCRANGGDLAAVSPPVNYVSACQSDGQAIAEGIRAVLDGRLDRFEDEYPCHGPDVERWFRVMVTPVAEGALVVHADITGEYERVARWLAATPTAILELDPKGRAVYVNPAWSDLTVRPVRALLGADWSVAFDTDDRERLLCDVHDCAATLREVTRDVRLLTGERWMRFSISPYVDGYGRLRRIMLVGMDVTRERELVRAQAADEERRRIGADVHDTVIQRLFAAAMVLDREVRATEPTSDVLSFVLNAVDTSISDLRSIALAPPEEAETRPDAAIAAVLDQATRALGFEPECDLRADLGRLSGQIVENLVAALSEGLANVARHAHASQCRVLLTSDDDAVTLRIADNGVGMPSTRLRRSGTANLARRAEALGGRAVWAPGPDGGTVLTWWVPLRHQFPQVEAAVSTRV